MMEWISVISDNPYFSAGFGLFGVGALAAAGRRMANAGVVLFQRHYVTTLGTSSSIMQPVVHLRSF